MGKIRCTVILSAIAALLAVTLSAASPLPAATLTCPDTVRPGVTAVATLHLTGRSISGVSFTLSPGDGLTLNACYVLSPGWTLDSNGDRYAAHTTANPVTALDVQFQFTAGAVPPGGAMTLTVDDLTLTDGRTDAELLSLRWQTVFLPARGDLNGDNLGDILDLQCLYAYLFGGTLPPSADASGFSAAADLNADGAVDILDYQFLYRLILS